MVGAQPLQKNKLNLQNIFSLKLLNLKKIYKHFRPSDHMFAVYVYFSKTSCLSCFLESNDVISYFDVFSYFPSPLSIYSILKKGKGEGVDTGEHLKLVLTATFSKDFIIDISFILYQLILVF